MCVYVDTYTHVYTHTCGLPRCLSGKESACQCRRCRFHPWVGKIPWRRKWQPSPVFLPGESHGQRSLGGYSPLESESQTHLSNWVHTCACVDVHTHTHTHTHTHVYMQKNKMRANPSLKDVWRSGDPTHDQETPHVHGACSAAWSGSPRLRWALSGVPGAAAQPSLPFSACGSIHPSPSWALLLPQLSFP